MQVAVTAVGTPYGNGWASLLAEDHEVTCLGSEKHPDLKTRVVDRTDYESVRPVFESQDAVVDLPAAGETTWEGQLQSIVGTYNFLEAARDAGVGTYVVGSSNKTVEGYEIERFPDLYEPDSEFIIDHTAPPKPRTLYGASRLFSEHMAQLYAESVDWQVGPENHTTYEREYPEQSYVIRWGSVRFGDRDHPYADAEKGVRDGHWDRDSHYYDLAVKRMKCAWLSTRDLKQLVELMLKDDTVTFDVFYGVSDNDHTWFDISHARDVLGYDPADNAHEWDGPPR